MRNDWWWNPGIGQAFGKAAALLAACSAIALAGCASAPPAARTLDRAGAVPLALDDAFEFRKIKTFLNDPDFVKPSEDRMLDFRTKHINYGAVNGYDKRQREGHYFTFFWKAKREADLVFRLEYRQDRLGSLVQAKEIEYPAAKGSRKTTFAIIGDDYREEGKITGWRALLIEDGRAVALAQSFLWN
jgi:hypothetical protein